MDKFHFIFLVGAYVTTLYLVALIGSELVRYVYEWVYDGGKEIKVLGKAFNEFKGRARTDYLFEFIFCCIIVGILLIMIASCFVTVLYEYAPVEYLVSISVIGSSYALAKLARFAIRLNKNIDKHEKDVNAHKGNN